jgi:hypothetical protein
MEVMMRAGSLTLLNHLNSNWEKELYTEPCSDEDRR